MASASIPARSMPATRPACLVLAYSNDNYFADNDITYGGDGVFLRPSPAGASSGNVLRAERHLVCQQQLHRGPMRGQYLPPKQGQPRQPRHLDRPGRTSRSSRTTSAATTACPAGSTTPPGVQVRARRAAKRHRRHHHGSAGATTPSAAATSASAIMAAGICLAINASPDAAQPGLPLDHGKQHRPATTAGESTWRRPTGSTWPATSWKTTATAISFRAASTRTSRSTPTIPRSPARPRPSWSPPIDGQAGRAGRRSKRARTWCLTPRAAATPTAIRSPSAGTSTTGRPPAGPRVTHAFQKIGPHSVGVTVNNGRFSDLAYRNFLAYEDVPEPATEGHAGRLELGRTPRTRRPMARAARGMKPSDASSRWWPTRKPRSRSATAAAVRLVGNDVAGPPRRARQRSRHPPPLSPDEERRHPLGGQDQPGLLGQDDQQERPRLEGAHAHGDDLRVAHQVLRAPPQRRRQELAGRLSTGSTRPCRCTAARSGISRARCRPQ